MDFADRQHVTSYVSLFSMVLGKTIETNGTISIEKNTPNGYALFAFDPSPNLTDSESFSLARQKTVRVDMTFGEALPSNAS